MKFLNHRVLGIIGIIGAPWMFINYINSGLYENFAATSASGFRIFIFTTGWLCCVLGLYKVHAMGDKRWQRIIVALQLLLLSFVDLWYVIEIFAPNTPSIVSFAFSFLWPATSFWMIVTGIIILGAKRLKGWKRFIPLLAGIWFPQAMLIYYFTQNSLLSFIISGIDSTVIFSLLGFIVATQNKPLVVVKKHFIV